MRKRLLFFSICAFLSISFNSWGGPCHFCPILTDPLGFEEGGLAFPADFDRAPVSGEPKSPESLALSAALCELEAWQAPDKATRDSLLLAKAEFLAEAGESVRAYETVCRIQRFGLSEDQRAELLRRKLIYSWEAGLADDFMVLLEEAAAFEPAETSALVQGSSATTALAQAAAPDEAIAMAMAPATALSHAVATASNISGKPRHRSPDAAMLLSIIPGAGLAYAGDWASAGKTFLAGAGSIALGVGAFASGLYLSAFLGGGMLLYTILPPSTEKAVRTVSEYNDTQLLQHYSKIIEKLGGM